MGYGYPSNYKYGAQGGYPSGGGEPPAFSPADLTHAVHWWKASQISGLANTDPVSTWEDQIGAADFAGSGTTRPLYYTNSGDPYVEFDGTDDTMNTTIASMSDYIVIAVYERVSNKAYGRLVHSNILGILVCQLDVNDSILFAPGGSPNITRATPSAPTGDMAVLAERIGTAGRLRVNGSEATNTLAATLSGTLLYLGANAAGTENGNKRIKELIICDAAFEAGEEAALAAYLNDEYGVTL